MDAYEPQHPQLKRVWSRLSAESRENRWKQAKEREVVVLAVANRKAGESKGEVLRRAGVERISWYRWQKRYQEYGLDGLMDWRNPPHPALSQEAREAVCTLRRADPQVKVEKLIEHVGEHHQEKTNATTVKKVLREAGLARRSGSPRGTREAGVQRLELGGMKLVEAALVETGYLEALAKGVLGCIQSAAENPDARPVDRTDRDDWGRFMPGYNERLRKKNPQDIGPGFESVEIKRKGMAVERLHVSGASLAVIERKLLGMMVSPVLGGTRWEGLRVSRGALLEEVCGYPYMPATMDLFARELKYLGVSATGWEVHARLFLEQTAQWGDPKRAAVAYADGTTKEVHTTLFSQASKVSQRNRVAPSLEVVALHTGAGVPLYEVTYSGRAPLVEAVPKMLEALGPVLAGTQVAQIVVIDAEGNSVAFLRGLEQGSPRRAWVTRLRPSLLAGKKIFNRSNYRAYRNGDRVRMGLVDLNSPPDSDPEPFRIRVIEIERRGTGTVTYLGASTLLKENEWKADETADLYFDRWPMQEANFRAVNQAVGSKDVHGYGKQLVDNITVLEEQEEVDARIQREMEVLEKETGKLQAQGEILREEERMLARSQRRLMTVNRAIQARVVEKERVTPALRRAVEEQSTLTEEIGKRSARVERLKKDQERARGRQKQREERLGEHAERHEELESRKKIYRHDVELDSLFNLMKVGLVLLITYVLKTYLGDACMEPGTFLECLATLTAHRRLTPHVELITFEYNRRHPDIMALLLEHREAINARGLVLRSGRRLRIEVEPAPPPVRPPPSPRRYNPGDRFRRHRPKV